MRLFLSLLLLCCSFQLMAAPAKKGKGKASAEYHIDAVSGATLTCNGVDDMFKRKLAPYYNYLNNVKAGKPVVEEAPVAAEATVETENVEQATAVADAQEKVEE